MYSQSRMSFQGRLFTGQTLSCLTFTVAVLGMTGCEEEVHHTGTKPSAKAPADSGPIIGQRTQEIRNATAELRQGKARVGSTRIVAKDPITLQGNAYVSIIGRAAVLSIQHALDLYHATNDRYPKDYDEFMSEIIQANGIALPKLPLYQKYGYDEKEHKLIILEYPDLKEQPTVQ
jgi:hypothetical protein